MRFSEARVVTHFDSRSSMTVGQVLQSQVMTRRRRFAVSISALGAMALIFASSYFYPRVANLSAIAFWILVFGLSVYAVVSWIYRLAKGEEPSHFHGYPRSFLRFAYDDDDEKQAAKTSPEKEKSV